MERSGNWDNERFDVTSIVQGYYVSFVGGGKTKRRRVRIFTCRSGNELLIWYWKQVNKR